LFVICPCCLLLRNYLCNIVDQRRQKEEAVEINAGVGIEEKERKRDLPHTYVYIFGSECVCVRKWWGWMLGIFQKFLDFPFSFTNTLPPLFPPSYSFTYCLFFMFRVLALPLWIFVLLLGGFLSPPLFTSHAAFLHIALYTYFHPYPPFLYASLFLAFFVPLAFWRSTHLARSLFVIFLQEQFKCKTKTKQ